MSSQRRAAMTVDVEDYFQVAAFDKIIPVTDWENYQLRAPHVTLRLAERFADRGIKATFFVLGWVAERSPSLVPTLQTMGHEIASHGYWHQKADRMDPETFYRDVLSAKRILEEQSGEAVLGYRAPSFSMGKHTQAHFDMLTEAGYAYSSSTYPVAHDHYGDPSLPIAPHCIDTENGPLWELPQSTIVLRGRQVPVGGGGYFRLLPWSLSRRAVSQFFTQRDFPYIFYCHPWECDPEQPRIPNAPLKSRFRHYVNLKKMEKKIYQLCALDGVQWETMRDIYEQARREEGK